MTVGQLIESLQGVDPNRIVIISRDSEGNEYSPLSGWSTGAYKPETSWSGRYGLEELTQDDIDYGYGVDDVISDGQPCVVLSPRN